MRPSHPPPALLRRYKYELEGSYVHTYRIRVCSNPFLSSKASSQGSRFSSIDIMSPSDSKRRPEKRTRSPFLIFRDEYVHAMKQKRTRTTRGRRLQGSFTSEAGVLWHNIPVSDKEIYVKAAESSKEGSHIYQKLLYHGQADI